MKRLYNSKTRSDLIMCHPSHYPCPQSLGSAAPHRMSYVNRTWEPGNGTEGLYHTVAPLLRDRKLFVKKFLKVTSQ